MTKVQLVMRNVRQIRTRMTEGNSNFYTKLRKSCGYYNEPRKNVWEINGVKFDDHNLLVFVEPDVAKRAQRNRHCLVALKSYARSGMILQISVQKKCTKEDPWSLNYQAPLRAIQSRRGVTLSVPICRVISFCLVMGRLS